MRQCKVNGCERERVYRDYCGMHHMRFVRHGSAVYEPPKEPNKIQCSAPGCVRLIRAQGLKPGKQKHTMCMAHIKYLKDRGTLERRTARADGQCFYGCGRIADVEGLNCKVHRGLAIRDGYIEPLVGAEKEAHRKAYFAKWCDDNRAHLNAWSAARKKRVRHATPVYEDLDAITAFYKDCPAGMHVDHIIPINGKNVCGLHVLPNLQYLAALDNMSKGSRYTPIRFDPYGLMSERI